MPDGTLSGGAANPFGDMQSFVNLLNSIFGTSGTTNTDVTSPEGLAAGMGFLPQLISMLTAQDYSPEAAERDSGPAVQLILRQAMESGMPGISGAENASGGYNSTTAALLKNDLATRAAAEGAALVAKNKATYGALRTGQANSVINLINSIINANRQSHTTTKSPTLSSRARNSALGAALGAAARNALGNKNPGMGGVGRGRQRYDPLAQIQNPDDLPPDLLSLIQNPESLPDQLSMDEMPEGGGPTPEVTVSNTDNFDAGASSDLFDMGSMLEPIDLGGDIQMDEFGPDFQLDDTLDDGTGDNQDWAWLDNYEFGSPEES